MSASIVGTIQAQVNLYGYSIFTILGNIGNVFIIILFSRQRQSACSIYLISGAIMNILYLTVIGPSQIFPWHYSGGTIGDVVLCKIFAYIPSNIAEVAKTMIILACIDRYMITNDRASFRAFSTPKRAKWIIFFIIIFWLLVSVHLPIMTTVVNGQCGRFGIYSTIFTVYAIFFVGIIPSTLMCIFGYLTYRNVRQRRVRVQPVAHNTIDANITVQRRDRELLILVMSEIFFYVITTVPFPLILSEMMISQYVVSNKSVLYSKIESLGLSIAFILLFINCAVPFCIYLISSKAFRRDFKELIINTYRKFRRQPIIQPVVMMHQALTQRDTRV